ncbi:RsmB/NOP family class I SAM-dependent RNA methyltransferase [Leeuwenhoekiella parthenopeia]|uniref:Methyltransferase domain-containing protein n=1 Tax=Leeuwenhoekiella parthenopeia TaxID=2890320 RepID=A0ABS8GR44_9FLAO|nr:methyltransferase domain-containing protein [Leeuwenhoekiella parthenopeia]MCC4212409.1 methyltransferase domain-containing protein [Leeuwenhoekiella parthenopeia]
MRLHRNLVFAVIDGLIEIFNEGGYADKVIAKQLKRDKRWGSRDRSFVAETTYDIVRWKRLYAAIADVGEPFERKDLWRLFAVWCTLRGIKLPDWPQFEETPTRRIKGKFDEFSNIRKLRESIPDWLDELGEKELGEKWDAEIAALNKQAPVILRVNRLKTNIGELQQKLVEEGHETENLKAYKDALQLQERANVFTTQAFKDGLFEVQDASSQLVAPYLGVEPGMRVIDACAGAGGKALHLAAEMDNKGQLIALDIYANKLKELKRRARRAGAFNIETRAIDSTKVIKKLHNSADRVLLDAPCTGLGVLSRNPDAKWKLQPDFVAKIQETQQTILRDYSRMVKPGGKMVYATCSILPSENQEQVKKFLKSEEGKNFSIEKQQTVLSSESGYDGFYMCLMVKKDEKK